MFPRNKERFKNTKIYFSSRFLLSPTIYKSCSQSISTCRSRSRSIHPRSYFSCFRSSHLLSHSASFSCGCHNHSSSSCNHLILCSFSLTFTNSSSQSNNLHFDLSQCKLFTQRLLRRSLRIHWLWRLLVNL